MLKLIYATDLNNNINIDFELKPDLKRFKELTKNNAIIMGNNTFKSLPKKPNLEGLNYRQNYVLSTNKLTYYLNYDITYLTREYPILDINKLINDIYKASQERDIFIIGGKQIYELFINKIDYIYQTVIYKTYTNKKQILFTFNQNEFNVVDKSEILEYNNIKYRFIDYKRKV